jgi:hypothetical protein
MLYTNEEQGASHPPSPAQHLHPEPWCFLSSVVTTVWLHPTLVLRLLVLLLFTLTPLGNLHLLNLHPLIRLKSLVSCWANPVFMIRISFFIYAYCCRNATRALKKVYSVPSCNFLLHSNIFDSRLFDLCSLSGSERASSVVGWPVLQRISCSS